MAKVPQNKDKDFDVIMPQIGFTDMSDEDQIATHEICREAYSKFSFIHSHKTVTYRTVA